MLIRSSGHPRHKILQTDKALPKDRSELRCQQVCDWRRANDRHEYLQYLRQQRENELLHHAVHKGGESTGKAKLQALAKGFQLKAKVHIEGHTPHARLLLWVPDKS